MGSWTQIAVYDTATEGSAKGVKSAFCFLLRLLQSSALFAEAASLSLLAPSSANRPSSPMTFSPVPPFSRFLHACDRPIEQVEKSLPSFVFDEDITAGLSPVHDVIVRAGVFDP